MLLREKSGAHLIFPLVCQDPTVDIINPVVHIQLSNVPHCFATFLLQQPCLHQLKLTWEPTKSPFKQKFVISFCIQLHTNAITDGRLVKSGRELIFHVIISLRWKYKTTPFLFHAWHNGLLSLGQM